MLLKRMHPALLILLYRRLEASRYLLHDAVRCYDVAVWERARDRVEAVLRSQNIPYEEGDDRKTADAVLRLSLE